jgi:hypothetical protein
MTTEAPLLLRFAMPLDPQRELDSNNRDDVPAAGKVAGVVEAMIGQRESRCTRVRNETTDDE